MSLTPLNGNRLRVHNVSQRAHNGVDVDNFQTAERAFEMSSTKKIVVELHLPHLDIAHTHDVVSNLIGSYMC